MNIWIHDMILYLNYKFHKPRYSCAVQTFHIKLFYWKPKEKISVLRIRVYWVWISASPSYIYPMWHPYKDMELQFKSYFIQRNIVYICIRLIFIPIYSVLIKNPIPELKYLEMLSYIIRSFYDSIGNNLDLFISNK